MKVPLSWLKEYVDIELAPKELAHWLTLAGVEAEGVKVIGDSWDNVVVGLVEAIAPHPNADRLRLATVNTGEGRETVVCGAPNVAAGQKIAFAHVGANLLDGHTGERSTLKPAKIRGVESRGMVCSEKELGLSGQHEGILVLPDDAPVGTPFAQYYGDAIIDFSPTPNRPDCLSVLGIAREAAAITGRPVKEPSLDYAEAGDPVERWTRVEIADPDLCYRYIVGVVTGVKVGPSPQWMQDRLTKAGMRPINNVVDITNYVMLEFGQPLHAFDYDRLAEHRLIARRTRKGERMPFIDGEVRELAAGMLGICDAQGPVSLAGVMGSSHTEVSDSTVNVLLESASFNNASIRRTSRELAMRSEASSRFEKGLSAELSMYGARRAMQLLVQLTGGTACKGFVDVYPGKAERKPVRLTQERTQRLLGTSVPQEEMVRVLGSLGFTATAQERGGVSVTVPYWRMDIGIEDDLIEELARIKGYEWIPTRIAAGNLPLFDPQPMLMLKERVRDVLAAAGVDEIVSYPLTNRETRLKSAVDGPEPLRPQHPISSDLEELRLTLRGNLLKALAANQRNQEGGVRLFEVGRIYVPRSEDLPEEREMLGFVLSGPRQEGHWQGAANNDLDFFDAKGVLESLFWELGVRASYTPTEHPFLHPGRAAQVAIGGVVVGSVGEVHPQAVAAFGLLPRAVILAEIDLAKLLPLAPEKAHMFRAIPRFPGVIRDVALVLDVAIPAGQVRDVIAVTPLVQRVDLFDAYVGDKVPPGKKSLAYRIVYQAPDRTLTSEEVQKAQTRLLERLKRELGADLRA